MCWGPGFLETRFALYSQLLFEFCGFLHFYTRHVNGAKLADVLFYFRVSVCASVHTQMHGRNFFTKAGGTIFFWGGVDRTRHRKRRENRVQTLHTGRGKPLPAGGGSRKGEFFITYSRKSAFWWIPDAFLRTTFEVVVCCVQDAAMLCDRFCQLFSDRLQFMGEGLAP